MSAVPADLPDAADPRAQTVSRARTPSLVAGGVLVGLVVLLAIVSFLWTPYDPQEVDAGARLLGPGGSHLLGTDKFGHDVVSQIMVGARTTLFVGVVSVGVAALLGVPLGILSAMSGRAVSVFVQRLNDLLLAFPALLLAIMFGAVFGASTLTAMVAIGLSTVPSFARVTRSSARQVMHTEYVLAARSAGRRGTGIALRHVLPNVTALVIVQASVSFAIAILAEAALSFLGFGTPPPTPSWGRMLQESQALLFTQPLLAVWPGLAIALAVLGFNLLGDGLRDLLDPTMERRS
jgi:peptide/nickel transport system permease protein